VEVVGEIHKEELHDLHIPLYSMGVINLRRMKCRMHRMNEKIRKNICPEKPKLKIHPEHRGTIDRQPEY
jgi:hypothetical protein